MTNPEFDAMVMSASAGLLAGTWLGYVLRGLRERVRSHRDEIRSVNEYRPYHEKAPRRPAMQAAPTFIALSQHKQETKPRIKAEAPMEMHPDRTTVLSALTSAGYKKVAALVAIDACTQPERTTVEAWTAAALRRAVQS